MREGFGGRVVRGGQGIGVESEGRRSEMWGGVRGVAVRGGRRERGEVGGDVAR